MPILVGEKPVFAGKKGSFDPFPPAFAGEKPVKNRQKKAEGLFSRRKGFEKAFPAGFNWFKSSFGAFIPPVGKEPLALFLPAFAGNAGKGRSKIAEGYFQPAKAGFCRPLAKDFFKTLFFAP